VIRRRDFITLLGGAAAWPLAAGAQQSSIPVIGFLEAGSPETLANMVAEFREGLSESGYVEGRNVVIEYRWANNELNRLPELAADLVRRGVAVISATPTSAALAAKAVTTVIPIVFYTGSDPVQIGLVASFSRPGGNLTGLYSINIGLAPKRLELLRELLPQAKRFGVLADLKLANFEASIRGVQMAAADIGGTVEVLSAGTAREIDGAFASLVEKRIEALMVLSSSLFLNRRVQLANLAARHAVPAIFSNREIAEAGGLMSYATSLPAEFHQVGIYVGRILKGEKAADLPVMQPTKFDFVINMQTARLLGLAVPPTLLAIADEVIE
jgi:putative ABC transport system substrate-binding protein